MNVLNKLLNDDITKCLMLVEFLSLLGKCNNPSMVFFCCGSWKYSSFVFVVPFSVSQALLVEAYTILKVYFCQEYCGTDVVLPSVKTAAQRVEVISAELWAVVTEFNTVVSFGEYGGNFVLSIESEIEELCLKLMAMMEKRWKQSMNLWQHLLMQYVWKHTDIT